MEDFTCLLTKTLAYEVAKASPSHIESQLFTHLTRKAMKQFLEYAQVMGIYRTQSTKYTDALAASLANYVTKELKDNERAKLESTLKDSAKVLGGSFHALKSKTERLYKRLQDIAYEVVRKPNRSTASSIERFHNGTKADLNLFSTADKIGGKVLIYSTDSDLTEIAKYAKKVHPKLRVKIQRIPQDSIAYRALH